MCFLIIKVILLASIFLPPTESIPWLCGRAKSLKKCYCEHKAPSPSATMTNTSTGMLELYADCTSMTLKNFPDSAQLPIYYLKHLDVSHNEIIELNYDNFDFASKALRTLVAKYNNITMMSDEFVMGIPNLEYLDLSHNRIKEISKITLDLPKLKVLDLSFNQLTIKNNVFTNLPVLTHLDLSYNLLTPSVTLDTLSISKNLICLTLNNVGLSNISAKFFDGYTNLKHISLADNNLVQIPEVPDVVTYLDLSGNYFVRLHAQYLMYHDLKTLKLNRLAQLEMVEHYAFYNLLALETLEIQNCPKLMDFNPLVFGVLTESEQLSLKKLYLAGNNLSKLSDSYYFLLKNLDEVTLHHNPWICDCDILWMYRNLRKIKHLSQVRCAAPKRHRRKPLQQIRQSEFNICSSNGYDRYVAPMLLLLIIFIICLTMYLIYVFFGKRLNYNLRNYGMGPSVTSPYQGISTTATTTN